MDALSAVHPARRVVFMKGAQVGATESGNNWLGYIMHRVPAPALAVQARFPPLGMSLPHLRRRRPRRCPCPTPSARAGGWRRAPAGCADQDEDTTMSNGVLRAQTRRIGAAIWGIVAVLLALGAGGAQVLPVLRALAQGVSP